MDDQALARPTGSARTEWRAHWPLVLATAAGMSLASVSSYSLGVMMYPIEQDLGWSRGQIASGPALVSFIAFGLSSLVGLAIDRVGARRIGLLSATLLCGALAAMSLATSNRWLWWLLWGLVGLATAAMPTVWTLPISRAFSKARGMALAVTLSGTGLGASLVPLVAGYVVAHHGWRHAYLALGGVWAVLVLPLIFVFFRDRAEPQQVATQKTPAAPKALAGLSALEGFRSVIFWKLALVGFGTSIAGTALVLNLVPILIDAEIDRWAAAAVAGIIGISTISGRIVGGYLMDRMDARWIAGGATIAAMVFPVIMLTMPGQLVPAIVGVIVFGVTAGPKMGAIIYLASRHFGPRSFGTLFGTIHAMLALGVGLGPLLANLLFDAQGSYSMVLWAALAVMVVVATIFLSLGSTPSEHQ